MKKLIALLLAVSAMSTSAFAFTVSPIGTAVDEHNGMSRNYVTADDVLYGASYFPSVGTGKDYLPTYRAGDVITFKIGEIAGTDNTLTFICSQQDGTEYTNSTVQMIDQVVLAPTDGIAYCTYKLRENLTDGLYKLEMRLDGLNETFSFLIGTPSVELLYINEIADGATPTKADKYLIRDGNAHCFGKATITGGAAAAQVDTDFGFVFEDIDSEFIIFTENTGTSISLDAQNALQASLDNGNNQEIGGEAQYFFRMVIEGVDSVDSLPDVDVYLNE